jgi:hypothetical protein
MEASQANNYSINSILYSQLPAETLCMSKEIGRAFMAQNPAENPAIPIQEMEWLDRHILSSIFRPKISSFKPTVSSEPWVLKIWIVMIVSIIGIVLFISSVRQSSHSETRSPPEWDYWAKQDAGFFLTWPVHQRVDQSMQRGMNEPWVFLSFIRPSGQTPSSLKFNRTMGRWAKSK